MKEFVINKFLSMRLEGSKTNIYVNDDRFDLCKFLMLKSPGGIYEFESIHEGETMDESVEVLGWTENGQEGVEYSEYGIDPESEFWGHCSNLQAWYEHDYDTRLLHSYLSFPLLKKLAEVGDPKAKNVFKTEIIKRIESGSITVLNYLWEVGFLKYIEEDVKSLGKDFIRVLIDSMLNVDFKGEKEVIYNIIQKAGYSIVEPIKEKITNKAERKAIDSISSEFKPLELVDDINIEKIIDEINLSFGENSKSKYVLRDDGVIEIYYRDQDQSKFVLRDDHIIKLYLIKDIEEAYYNKEYEESSIETVPDEIINLKHLKELYILMLGSEGYGIEVKLPNKINQLPLETLYIDACIRDFNFEGLNSLRSFIAVGGIEPNLFDESFFGLETLPLLKVLNLSHNNMKDIPGIIGSMSQLEELYLSNNPLSSLPDSFKNLTNLRVLDLSETDLNDFYRLPWILKHLTSLRELTLPPSRVSGPIINLSGYYVDETYDSLLLDLAVAKSLYGNIYEKNTSFSREQLWILKSGLNCQYAPLKNILHVFKINYLEYGKSKFKDSYKELKELSIQEKFILRTMVDRDRLSYRDFDKGARYGKYILDKKIRTLYPRFKKIIELEKKSCRGLDYKAIQNKFSHIDLDEDTFLESVKGLNHLDFVSIKNDDTYEFELDFNGITLILSAILNELLKNEDF